MYIHWYLYSVACVFCNQEDNGIDMIQWCSYTVSSYRTIAQLGQLQQYTHWCQRNYCDGRVPTPVYKYTGSVLLSQYMWRYAHNCEIQLCIHQHCCIESHCRQTHCGNGIDMIRHCLHIRCFRRICCIPEIDIHWNLLSEETPRHMQGHIILIFENPWCITKKKESN